MYKLSMNQLIKHTYKLHTSKQKFNSFFNIFATNNLSVLQQLKNFTSIIQNKSGKSLHCTSGLQPQAVYINNLVYLNKRMF